MSQEISKEPQAHNFLLNIREEIEDFRRKNPKDTQTLFELSPAKKISNQIYDYCQSAAYFNELLSEIARLKWDKVFQGEQYSYFLEDMILAVGPDGKQISYIPKTLSDFFWVYTDMIDPTIPPNKNAIDPNSSEQILISHFRFRILKKIPIGNDRFPPINKYHHKERKVYRTYINKDVVFQFEIIRPIDCHKSFEDLLLSKFDSKYLIKIYVKNPLNLGKYFSIFTKNSNPDAELQQFIL